MVQRLWRYRSKAHKRIIYTFNALIAPKAIFLLYFKLNIKEMQTQDQQYIKRAIALARKGMDSGAGGPFGCVIVKDGQVIGEGHNEVLLNNDPTAHAEIVAIRRATQHLQSFQLNDCIVYTSCEPCPMCLGAIYWARPLKVVYAATKHDAADAGFDDSFIYEEIELPVERRKLPIQQLSTEDAVEVFSEWKSKFDKKPY
jgi:guanine deaminase